MLFIKSQTNNPYFNIATEEYLLKNFDDDFFYLYINEPSIIVGKHQNTTAEINVPYVVENNIKVVRRLSGGGTVFHDSGNLNYCFIQKGKEGFLVDFKKYSQPVLNTLNKLGVNAYLHGKSDLVINKLKFSGNAEHVYRKKVLHHGTMLFSSELTTLNEAIKSDWTKFEDKAVRSNRSKVTNILSHLPEKISLEQFSNNIKDEVLLEQSNSTEYQLTNTDIRKINELVDEKYTQWDWNFGYSPKYRLNQNCKTPIGVIKVNMGIEKGTVTELTMSADGLPQNHFAPIVENLIGCKHDYQTFYNYLNDYLANDTALQLKPYELIKAFF